MLQSVAFSAGSGKTWVLAAAGRAWAAAGLGRVIGITPSQSARNTLAAGVPVSYNTAQFLGHLPSQRGARGPVQLRPGDLVLIDGASMVSTPDLADVVTQAAAAGAKLILAGDTQQLQAVENGGGMSLLADALGFAQLIEPVRFRAAWEQAASLRLRAGDTSVLAEYDQHGRIRGGEPEQMMDAAAAAYLALTLDGVDTLLMAADHALRRELNRRIREDLITLGVVRRARGDDRRRHRASAGDLIICTRNDHGVQAGEPGRTLANGDLLRIEAVTEDGLLVRRALGADPATGQRRWTDRRFAFNVYQDAELGYAVTDHAAQSRTVTAGLAVITGTEDRQHGYVALSRGTEVNLAYVFTALAQDRRPGPRPAPGPRARPLRPPRHHPRAARPLPPPPRQRRRSPCWLACWTATASSNPPPRPATRPWPTPTTWPSCTRSGPPRPPRPGTSSTTTCSWTSCRPGTAGNPATRPGGCGALCAPPNWPAWTRPGPWPTRSPNGTWPDPATSPPSSTPASGTGPEAWSRSRPGRGRSRSPPSPTPNARPMSPRSPR